MKSKVVKVYCLLFVWVLKFVSCHKAKTYAGGFGESNAEDSICTCGVECNKMTEKTA